MNRLRLVLLAAAASVCLVAFAGEAEWKSYMDTGHAAYLRGDYGAAISSLQAALKEAESFSSDRLAFTLNELALAMAAQGRPAEAEALFRRSLAIREKALGPEHPGVARSLNNLAALYREQKRLGEGLDAARRATAILGRRFTSRARQERAGALTEQRAESFGFEQHVLLLADEAAQRPAASASHAAEGFEVAQLARASDTAEQVARMAARFAAGSDALARSARQRQDLRARVEQLDATILREVSRPAAQRDAHREQQTRDEQAALLRQIADVDARLEREFPQYKELTAAKPLALDAGQKLLGGDEALVVFLVSRNESLVWGVRRDTASFQRLPVKRTDLEALVKRLRAQLDLGSSDTIATLTRPFDAAAANELYRRLFTPIEPLLAGARHLIIVPDGALQSVPFAALVTEPTPKPLPSLRDLVARSGGARNLGIAPVAPPAPAAASEAAFAYAEVAWLLKKYAITVLPAVSSLRALRAFAKSPPGAEPFTGFGDPVLGGQPGEARAANLATLFSRGAVADVTEVRKMQRLPDTADELKAIAATLKGRGENLYLGQAATETRVKSLDLSRFRHIAFATHGLMAGDIKGVAEPALVLTPPERGTEQDDGLLTASEIAQLKLNADWVILSACNTAAPDGTPGAEGLSGLAKSFFYAGARSMLVSHWAVSSDAAVALTTRTFEEAAKGASKAEALRRSMLALMQNQDKAYFAHPAMWAPFILVGEGNSAWAGASAGVQANTGPAPTSLPALTTQAASSGALMHAGAETLYRDALTTPVAGIVRRLTAMKRLLK